MAKQVFRLDFCGRVITVETGEIAKQAGGSVLVRYDDTVVLSTATASNQPKEGLDFFPLTADMTVYIAEFFKTCVCIFVFITGYGMTQSLKKNHPDFNVSPQDTLSYPRHRLISLLSNFIFVYLLVIIVSFPTGRFFEIYRRSGSSVLYVLVDMFGLAKLFKTPTYVGTW